MERKRQMIIGSVQMVQLPDYNCFNVPAKIDTGADDSSIWASSIYENDGVLVFKLFSPKSSFYNGKEIKTTKYSVVQVKNSFGKREVRYKVNLLFEIQGETYDVSINLSDRSNSKYPILIGKKLLKGRFVVDVCKRDTTVVDYNKNKKRIVILKSVIDQKTVNFLDLLSKTSSSEVVLTNYKTLRFEINEHNEPKILLSDGTDIALAKVVYFKSHNLYPEHASAVAQYLKYKHVSFFDNEVANFVSSSKLSEMFVLAINDVTVPKSLIVSEKNDIPDYDTLKGDFGNSFVIKGANSDRGKNNYIVKDRASFGQVIARIEKSNAYIIQQYIENDGYVRVLMMGGRIIQIVKRRSVGHKDPLKAHLNKPMGGANAIELNEAECSSELLALARRAAIAMHRSIVGVDLIQDNKTKKWYVLEANNNPDITGGINVENKIKGLANFLELENR